MDILLNTYLHQAMLTLVVAIFVRSLLDIVYNLYFHPLAKFPGPRTWTISRLPYVYQLARGRLAHRTRDLHDIYGPIVRLAPNELSFIDGRAWDDIYGYRSGKPDFPKNPLWLTPSEKGVYSILNANAADHSRYRRLLSHAFSERALTQQEELLRSYIDLLVEQLRRRASTKDTAEIDLVQWFNYTTFDIIGDLSLGESFQCLEKSSYHEWVSLLFKSFKAIAIVISLRFYSLDKLAIRLLPMSLVKKRAQHRDMANEKLHRRLAQGQNTAASRNDFISYILRHNDEKGMSTDEIEETLRVVLAAGSETTATALSAVMRKLLQHPTTYQRLKMEVRNAFRNPSEIRAQAVASLPYLNAVIEETLRLCPPVPIGLPRIVPDAGAEVAGHWLPGGTFVSAPSLASNRSDLNFPTDPLVFNPSRWLGPGSDMSQRSAGGKFHASTNNPAFNPFSLGPRNCIGRNLAYLEMRLILANLTWSFDFELPGPGEGLSQLRDWDEQKVFILWEKFPLEVIVKSR